MHPAKVRRDNLRTLTDLPNIGPSLAETLRQIGIHAPTDLVGKDPYDLYRDLFSRTGSRHDPCVLDVFMAVTDFMNGADAKAWWDYTARRKRMYGQCPELS